MNILSWLKNGFGITQCVNNATDANVYQSMGSLSVTNGLAEDLHRALKGLNFITATDVVDSIKRITNISDAFEVQIDLNSPGHFRVVPKTTHGNEKILLRGFVVCDLPQEYAKFKSIEDLSKHCYFKQLSLSLRVVKFDLLLEDKNIFHFDRAEETNPSQISFGFFTEAGMDVEVKKIGKSIIDNEIRIIPPPFPPPLPYIIETIGQSSVGMPVELGVEEIDDLGTHIKIVLGNHKQSFPIKSVFSVMIPKQVQAIDCTNVPVDMDYDFTILPEATKYHFMLLSRLLLNSLNDGRIVLRSTENGSILCTGRGLNLQGHMLPFFSFWKLIGDIEQNFDVELNPPDDCSREDRHELWKLDHIISTGKYRQKCSGVTMSFAKSPALYAYLDAPKESRNFVGKARETCKLFNQEFAIGTCMMFASILCAKNPSKLRQDLDTCSDGEPIAIEFSIARDEEVLFVYPRFYGSDDENLIAEREGLSGSV